MSLELKAYYMHAVHEDVSELAEDLRFSIGAVRFDTLVGTGLSGALIIPRLAKELGADWLIMRKPDDGTHSSYPAEGALGKRWLFVDDCISTGSTYARVFNAIKDIKATYKHRCSHAGVFLYEHSEFIRSDAPRLKQILRTRKVKAG